VARPGHGCISVLATFADRGSGHFGVAIYSRQGSSPPLLATTRSMASEAYEGAWNI